MITLSGTLQSVAGGTAELGSVVIQLCGYGGQVPMVPGISELAKTRSPELPTDANGKWTVALYGNDAIAPAGTYYTVAVRDANGDTAQVNAYYLTGPTAAIDLSNLTPFDPTGLAVSPLPIVNLLVPMTWSAAPVFNGAAGLTFEFPLQGATAGATFPAPVPGNLYTFVLIQDGAGGHAFTWPANVKGGGAINLQPGGGTLQVFVSRSDLTLDATGAGVWV